MKNSKIEWTDHTFNPWRGCTKVSPGCANCYAETLSKRNPALLGQWGPGKPRVRASAKMWAEPLKWNRESWEGVEEGTLLDKNIRRKRVFCASLADWLDDEVPLPWLIDLLFLIDACKDLDWLLLTKRPHLWEARMKAMVKWRSFCIGAKLAASWLDGNAPANVWIGTSVEDQARADQRIPALLQIPAKVRFLSCEPLLGPVEIPFFGTLPDRFPGDGYRMCYQQIHWVIAGGESGPGARPMHPAWARSLRDQCQAAGVPFLFKQWGEWFPGFTSDAGDRDGFELDEVHGGEAITDLVADRALQRHEFPTEDDGTYQEMFRVGKAAAGRLLDGRLHDEFPQ